jgi:PAS domain S-box-containing protein
MTDKNIGPFDHKEIQNGLLLINTNGTIIWADNNYLKLTNFENSEVINSALVDLFDSKESNLEELKKVIISIKKGVDFDIEVFLKKNNNSTFLSRIIGNPVTDSQGILFQYVVSVGVIAKDDGVLDRLKESESTLFSFLMNLQKGILLEDENRKIVAVNKEFCSMFSLEMDPNFIVGLDCNEFEEQNKSFFKNSDQYVYRINQLLEKKEIVINDELELVDGRFFERTFIPIIKEGSNKGRLWSYNDSTINKNYKENLNYEKGKYRRIIANMNIGLLEVDNEDTIILANQSFSEMSGYSIDELIGKKGAELFLDVVAKEKLIEKGIERREGKSDSYEIVIKNKNGDLKNWLISGAPNYNINGEVIGSIGIHLNITEQKSQEEQLILLSLIAEKNINSVIICDNQGKIEWVNDSFITMSEYTFEEVVGKKPGHLLQGKDSDLEQINYLRTQIRLGLPFKCELINYKKSGEKYWVYLQGQALYNKEGKILKYFAIEEDITNTINLKLQKEELVNSAAKTNKDLESYAFIASHDLKAPIRSIYSLVTFIKEDNDFTEQTKNYFSIIESKLEKMDHQIEGILEYAKIDKDDFFYEEVNCNEIIKISLENLLIPDNIKVTIVKELPIIKADRFRVQQLFQNVISNAINFIDKPKGIVEIDCIEERNKYIFSVKDNGPGVAKENQNQIFNISKYFNNNNRSSGLGLSIAKKIVEICNGTIWIESELGVGTTFFIELKK